MKNKYGFPLCIQLGLPEDYLENKEFQQIMELLKSKDFYGVELNITDFEKIEPKKLKEYLARFGLKLTMVASGAYAKKHGLSLTSEDEVVRKRTVEEMKRISRFAEKMNAGIICGFIKGGPEGNLHVARLQMEKSLKELAEDNNQTVDIYLEATNHYESLMINRVEEGVVMAEIAGEIIKVLPDTYHMNIEENSKYGAIVKFGKYFKNLHISDNNRYYPGFGAIDFFELFKFLKDIDYRGTVTIEGRNKGTMLSDICRTCDYLECIANGL